MTPVGRIDAWVDRQFEPLRKSGIANRVFYLASAVGDDGRLWLGLSIVKLVPSRRSRIDGLDLAAWLGIESAVVNGPMKWMTRRSRPEAREDPHPHRVRRPGTSSFPSGHSASAFTMATMLAKGGGYRYLWFVPASAIAVSRIHTGMHHASDVAAGAVVGVGLGLVGRRVPISEPIIGQLDRVGFVRPILGWVRLAPVDNVRSMALRHR